MGRGEAAGLLAVQDSTAGSHAMGDRVQYELQYTGLYSRSAYLPYGVDLETISGRYRTRGDYVVEKSPGQESLAFLQSFYSWYNV